MQDYHGTEIHPRILELVFKLQTFVLEHSNQVCIATLLALKEFLNDYKDSESLAAIDQKRNLIPSLQLAPV